MCCLCDPWHITWTDLVDTFAQFSSFECSSSANALFLASFYRLAVVWFVLLWLFIDRYLYLLFAIYLDTIYFIPFLNHCGKFLLHQKDPTHFGTSVLTNFFLVKKDQLQTIFPNNNSKKPLSGSPAGAALFESAGGGAAAGATGGAGARHAGAETRRVVPRRVETETEETWRWPDAVDILTCGDGGDVAWLLCRWLHCCLMISDHRRSLGV